MGVSKNTSTVFAAMGWMEDIARRMRNMTVLSELGKLKKIQ